jgi:hypothetical protein
MSATLAHLAHFAHLLLVVLVAATAGLRGQAPPDVDLAGRRAEYQARAARLTDDDVVGHFALAQWCDQQGLKMARAWELRRVLQHAPDHQLARRMSGHVRRAGGWLNADAAHRAADREKVDGRWIRKPDAEPRPPARDRAPTREQRREADRLLVRLADAQPASRREALADLEVLARVAAWPELLVRARRRHLTYEQFWRTHRSRPVSTGLLSIELQRSRLLGVDTRTLGLGVGVPVRIQLPRVESISIGTTIPIPLAGRR